MTFSVPATRNLLLFTAIAAGMVTSWALPVLAGGSTVALVAGALLFGMLTQPLWALLHECMHDMFHPDRRVNDLFGFLMSAVQPSSFKLLRCVHSGHHVSNRSKRERIEYYSEGESHVRKSVLYYALLFGLNWMGFVGQNVMFTLVPVPLIRRWRLDQRFGSTLPSLSDGALRRFALEFGAVVLLHAALVALTPVTLGQYALYLWTNALFYSQLRYIYHYESDFDVVDGAFDLRAPTWLSRCLLNSTYHLTHHRNPRVPWIHLPAIAVGERQHSMGARILRQWHGVMPEVSQPRRHGRVIRWNGQSMF